MDLISWMYLSNLVLLSCHEVDSAYWKEWDLFGVKNKSAIQGFVIVHIPAFFIFFLGLILIHQKQLSGGIISAILSLSGIFAFFFHFYHLSKGKKAFNNFTSRSILTMILLLSVFQLILSLQFIFYYE